MGYTEWALAVMALGFIVIGCLASARWFQSMSMNLIEWQSKLNVPLALENVVRRRVARRLRWQAIGFLVGLGAAFAVAKLENMPDTLWLFWICAAGSVCGGAFATALISLIGEVRRRDSSVRVARLQRVIPRDYVAPALHVAIWCAFFLVGAALVVSWVVVGRLALLPAAVLVLLAGIALVFYELASRAICRHKQFAASAEELMWDDAFRSQALRDMISAPVYAIIFGASLTIVLVERSRGSSGWPIPVELLTLVALIVGSRFSRTTHSRYLDRLWRGARLPERPLVELTDAEAATR